MESKEGNGMKTWTRLEVERLESLLSNIGINMYDEYGGTRSFADIFDEVGDKLAEED